MVAHGPGKCSDDQGAVTRALIRADPSAEAIRWVLSVAEARAVSSAEAMPGGSSVAMHRFNLVIDDDRSRQLILRRYVRPEQLAYDPGGAAHEAMVLSSSPAWPRRHQVWSVATLPATSLVRRQC